MSSVRDFGAVGDGRHDDSDAIQHAIDMGDGVVAFPPGDYLLTRTMEVDLRQRNRVGLTGSIGTARVIMAAAGPAFHLIGAHGGTAQPADFSPEAWQRERMPTATNLEIEGAHAEADGFLLEGTMQSTFEGVLLRKLRHGIRVTRRARNVLISHCHIYHNTGIGVFLDEVNLHQAIISASHISYCLAGGIKIVGSEIRNLQITGNDIEYNYDESAQESADVWIDSSADNATVREATIASNTIQAKSSPGGANIRIIGHNPQDNHKAGMMAISGNLIGSQEINVHLVACRGVTVAGNVIYSGTHRNLQLNGCRNIVIGPNSFDHNPDYRDKELCTSVRIAESRDCTLTGTIIQDSQAGQHTVAGVEPVERDGLLEIVRSRRINVSGCEFLDGYPACVHIDSSDFVSLTGCTLTDGRTEKKTEHALVWRGNGSNNFLAANTIGRGTMGTTKIDDRSGVKAGDNLIEENI
ncbi:MAG: right-handed parallel beta-helix repeat-containing protein [Pirellulales bacterium]